jgi:phosphoglycolate phosphatase
MRSALEKLSAPCPADDVLASFIGPPLRRTFATLLETSDRSLIERALALYREEYGDTGLFENHVYAGVTQMLDPAGGVASTAFVATLKPKVYADDKADLLAHLLATEKVSPERAVMIGDRPGDIVSARVNRVRSIGVLWGYGSESELTDARADGLCASPAELASCLGRLAL